MSTNHTRRTWHHSLSLSFVVAAGCGGRAGLQPGLLEDNTSLTSGGTASAEEDKKAGVGGHQQTEAPGIGGSFSQGGSKGSPPLNSNESGGSSPTANSGGAASDVKNGQDNTGGTVSPWSTCPPGTYVVSPGTETSDKVCKSCESDSFTDKENQNTCQPQIKCSLGQQIATPGTSSNETVCEPGSKFPLHPILPDSVTGKLVAAGEQLYLLNDVYQAFATETVRYQLNGDKLPPWFLEEEPSSLDAISAHENSIYQSTIYNSIEGTAALIRKYDSDANVLWEQTFGQLNQWFVNIQLTTHPDGVYLAAVLYNGVHVYYDLVVGSYSHAGEELWQKTIELPERNQLFDIEVSQTGSLFVVGHSATGPDAAYLLELDTTGQLVTEHYGSDLKCIACTELALGLDGKLFAVGAARDQSALEEAPEAYPAIISQIEPGGDVLETHRFPIHINDSIRDTLVTDKGIHLVGTFQGDALFILIDKQGNVISRTTAGGSAVETATGIVQATDGRIFVGGYSILNDAAGAFVVPWPEETTP